MFIHQTVLLADDQKSTREQLRDLLRATQCAVAGEANSTDDTLYKFELLRPNVVIIDVTLLGTLDALVAIQRMRRQDPDVAIFSTGTASQSGVIMESLSMGASDFFFKPYHQKAVRDCFERNVG